MINVSIKKFLVSILTIFFSLTPVVPLHAATTAPAPSSMQGSSTAPVIAVMPVAPPATGTNTTPPVNPKMPTMDSTLFQGGITPLTTVPVPIALPPIPAAPDPNMVKIPTYSSPVTTPAPVTPASLLAESQPYLNEITAAFTALGNAQTQATVQQQLDVITTAAFNMQQLLPPSGTSRLNGNLVSVLRSQSDVARGNIAGGGNPDPNAVLWGNDPAWRQYRLRRISESIDKIRATAQSNILTLSTGLPPGTSNAISTSNSNLGNDSNNLFDLRNRGQGTQDQIHALLVGTPAMNGRPAVKGPLASLDDDLTAIQNTINNLGPGSFRDDWLLVFNREKQNIQTLEGQIPVAIPDTNQWRIDRIKVQDTCTAINRLHTILESFPQLPQ